MKRSFVCLALAALAAGVTARAQAPDVNKVLADARAALGGEKKLTALKTLAATGQAVRVTNDASSAPADAEFAFELPDKYMKKDVVAMAPNGAITRTSGFNGEQAINVVDQPPAMPGVVQIIRTFNGPGDGPSTPEQQEEARKRLLLSVRQEYARLLLGIIAASPAGYPLEFSYGGQAESPDGKADIVDVKGEGEFAARLFIDARTHLPLMLSWMAREPLLITRTVGGPGARPAPGGANVVQFSGHAQAPATPEERANMMKEAQEAARAAEAKRRIVEYRLYYGDYRDVDGLKVPFKLQRSIDGKPSEEVTLEKVKINGEIDPKKFETTK